MSKSQNENEAAVSKFEFSESLVSGMAVLSDVGPSSYAGLSLSDVLIDGELYLEVVARLRKTKRAPTFSLHSQMFFEAMRNVKPGNPVEFMVASLIMDHWALQFSALMLEIGLCELQADSTRVFDPVEGIGMDALKSKIAVKPELIVEALQSLRKTHTIQEEVDETELASWTIGVGPLLKLERQGWLQLDRGEL